MSRNVKSVEKRMAISISFILIFVVARLIRE